MLFTDQSRNRNSQELIVSSIHELAQSLESGKKEALSSYLHIMARFHDYSPRNVLLIAAQRPDATHIEGVRSWNELGRFVRPGEKGIFIYAPAIAGNPKPETSGGNGTKKNGKEKVLGFRGVHVFDIAQTGGEQQPPSQEAVNIPDALARLTAFIESQGMTLEHADWIAPARATSYRGTIRILSNLEPEEAFPAVVREVASQLLYITQRRTVVTRSLHQEEANAAASVVCDALKIEVKTAFCDYPLYYGDERLLSESLQAIHRTAAQILRAIRPEQESTQGVQ